jgi:hypothetical protein
MKLGTYRRTLVDILPFVAAVALLLGGLWMRWPTVVYDGLANRNAYNQFAFDHFAYSDIASLYFRDGLAGHPRPYFDYPLEYPVGTGLLVYLFNSVTRTMPQYFLLTSLWMAASALWIAALIPRFPRGKLLLFALSPALALYVSLNWDMWGVLLTVVALLLFVRERDGLATVVLTAAIWTKFFPILFLPFLVLDRLRRGGRRDAGRILTIFALGSVAINAPVLLLAPAGWWYFFVFNTARPQLWNLWMFFDPSWLSTGEINRVSTLLLLGGLVVLLLLQWRSPPEAGGIRPAWLPACCAILAWFFFVSKAYSPQYGLWIVALLAIIGASAALAVAWSAVDLLYFAASFVTLELWQYGDAQGWFVHYGLEPATALREGMLLMVIGWCVKQMRAPTRDPTRDRDEHPQGSPASVA